MESISGSVVPLGMYICQNKARIRWKSPSKIENKAYLTNVIGDLCEEENQISTGDDRVKSNLKTEEKKHLSGRGA